VSAVASVREYIGVLGWRIAHRSGLATRCVQIIPIESKGEQFLRGHDTAVTYSPPRCAINSAYRWSESCCMKLSTMLTSLP
jgi:hypothetical protein